MGRKIFISYKYSDTQVASINNSNNAATTRDYVDILQKKLRITEHIFKGEHDNEDLSKLKETTIEAQIRNRLFDSTITLVFITKGMKEQGAEYYQWIPWEIAYSLKHHTRKNQTSLTQGLLAVVIPDENRKYDFFAKELNSRTLQLNLDFLFPILRKNMFNRNGDAPAKDYTIDKYRSKKCYIHSVLWKDFVKDMNKYIEIAASRKLNVDQYKLTKTLEREV